MFELEQSWNHEWVITDKILKDFLSVSNDYNPMHVDTHYAKSKGFKDKIAHGNILSCFMSYFIGELLPIKNLLIIGQSIKFENVIYVNDTIRLDTSISRYSASVKFVQFNFRFTRNDTQVASGEIQIKIL